MVPLAEHCTLSGRHRDDGGCWFWPAEARLRDIQAITDAALSRLDDHDFLAELPDRAKDVLQADTAAVLLLDYSSGTLIATAAAGLEEEVSQGVRIPVGRGFAGRIAAEHRPVILDHVDHTTVLNPILLSKGIRTLMGVPMVAAGRVIGVMHVGSLTPREFTGQDAELLQLAADRAATAVRSQTARDDRLAAAALQRSLLPTALPVVPGAEMAARYVPGQGVVGGDWYDVFVLPSGELGVVTGDVAGSGLPAAVIMGRMRSALRAYALETAAHRDADSLTYLLLQARRCRRDQLTGRVIQQQHRRRVGLQDVLCPVQQFGEKVMIVKTGQGRIGDCLDVPQPGLSGARTNVRRHLDASRWGAVRCQRDHSGASQTCQSHFGWPVNRYDETTGSGWLAGRTQQG